MSEEEIARIESLCCQRDHLGGAYVSDEKRMGVLRAIADEVPGLLAAVKKLKKELILACEPPDHPGEVY